MTGWREMMEERYSVTDVMKMTKWKGKMAEDSVNRMVKEFWEEAQEEAGGEGSGEEGGERGGQESSNLAPDSEQ